MALVLIVISALDWHDSPLDTSALTISSLWTVLTLIDGAVLILSNSSVRRTLVQWFRPRNIPDENQLTSDNESSCKYYIQGYAPVVRFLYSCFCLLPLVLVEGFSAVQTVAANAALGSSGNGTVNLTVNLTEYVLSGEYNNVTTGLRIAHFVLSGTSVLVFVEVALVAMVACVLYKSRKFHHLVQNDPKMRLILYIALSVH